MPTVHSRSLGLTDTGGFRRNLIELIDEARESHFRMRSPRMQSSFLALCAPVMVRSLKYKRDTEAASRP